MPLRKTPALDPRLWPGLDLHHLRQGEAHGIRPVGGPWPPVFPRENAGLFTGKDMAFTSKKAWERCGMLYIFKMKRYYEKTWV